MHLNSGLLFSRYAVDYFKDARKVLEIGPDTIPSTYQRLVAMTSIEWQFADLVTSSDAGGKRIFGGGRLQDVAYPMSSEYEIPAADEMFDVVVAGQVIEHVRRIWLWARELARVCRRGGFVVTIAPVSWPYHEAPVDCWRIYPEGMRALCDEAGLEIVLSKFESLEPRRSRRWYPGESQDDAGNRTFRSRLAARVKGALNWPMSTAVDTITIARKPLSPER